MKTLWKKGYRTLRWQVLDPNGDPLRYELAFRSEEQPGDWLPIASDLDEEQYGFDATVLPDGLYRFRLTAADSKGNQPEEALTAERIGEPVVIDHSPPTLVSAVRQGDRLVVEVGDGLSPLREAMVSVDAGEWRPARAADGLLDGHAERLEIELSGSARLVLLRLTDAAFNDATVDLTRYLR